MRNFNTRTIITYIQPPSHLPPKNFTLLRLSFHLFLSIWCLRVAISRFRPLSLIHPQIPAAMAEYVFGGTDEENAELKKLNAEVVCDLCAGIASHANAFFFFF